MQLTIPELRERACQHLRNFRAFKTAIPLYAWDEYNHYLTAKDATIR